MKTGIHPQYVQATVTCASCGKKFTFGSTQENIHVELCSNCHPFYTGAQRFVDSANRIDKFQKKQELAAKFKATVTKKKDEEKAKATGPKSLSEMLAALK